LPEQPALARGAAFFAWLTLRLFLDLFRRGDLP
jgi:hypothetical protein